MSEENNEGGLSGLKKTIIGTIGTVVTAGGVWLTTHLGGGEAEHKEEPKTEVKESRLSNILKYFRK